MTRDMVLDVQGDVTEPQVAAPSLLDRITKARDERMQDEELLLPVPSWAGALVGRYKVIDVRKIAQAAKSDPVGSNSDFIANACTGLLLRDESGELVELLEDDGLPSGFNQALAVKLGVPDLKTAREVVNFAFKGNGVAIITHADTIATWMRDTSVEVDGQLVGESVTTRRSET